VIVIQTPLTVSGTESIVAAGPYDPLQSTTPLPLQAEYFPMGYPLSIATNSKRVHLTAARIWSRYPCLSDEPAVRLNIAVTADGGVPAPPPPSFRGRDHLFSVVADRDNFATADLRTGVGFACFTENISNDYLRYQFLEPLAYVLIAARYLTFTHAACVTLSGRGILLCGDSGAGKTCLAFACARKGWTFLSGDATAIVRGRDDYRILGRPYEIRFRETARRLFPELERYPRAIRPNGKDDIEIDPRDLRLKCALKGTASQIVFLERSDYPIPAVAETFPRSKALRHLEQAICFGDEYIRDEQRRSLEAFLALPTLRLRYSDLDSAERVLRSHVAGRS
jgi:hypothetical protein